eukprot:4904008-Amphidinium_carterae.2
MSWESPRVASDAKTGMSAFNKSMRVKEAMLSMSLKNGRARGHMADGHCARGNKAQLTMREVLSNHGSGLCACVDS